MAKRRNSSSSTKGADNPAIDLLKTVSQVSASRNLKAGTSSDVSRLSVGTQISAKPLQFGSPSQKASSLNSKSTSSWTALLGSISSSGISDLLGGGGLLSSGLDYLTNGLESLLGGGDDSSAQALTPFALPDSRDQAIDIDNSQTSGRSTIPSGAYNNSTLSQLSQTSKAQIVQTVKNALLTSSSLNDVIGEL